LFPLLGIVAVLLGTDAHAGDHPIDVTLLKLNDATPARRRFTLRATLPAERPAGEDPRRIGARVEIAGALPGDGATDMIVLPASLWRGRGKPRGATGFTYVDRGAGTGVRKVVVRFGRHGASLFIRAGGRNWPYRLTQAQGPVDVRFAIGPDLYCGRVASFVRNEPPRLLGRNAAAPDTCGAATAIRCGDGAADGTEECDDGNSEAGDGCSPACQLESVSARCAGVPAVSGTGVATERVASGLENPVHITAPALDPNRVFVVEQRGRVRIIENAVLLPGAFLSIEDRVSCCGERGLLSAAFHPDFEANGRLFVNYTDNDGNTIIARYHVTEDPNRIDPATETRLLMIEQPFANHNGGQIAFGPDGYLYVGMGDGGSGGDPQRNAQSDATLLGKMLRLDVDVEAPPYHAAPPGNPNASAGGGLGLIWAKGLRNPWRFSFDRGTGDLYIADVGQNAWEEISVQPAASAGGENYGWDVFEGDHCVEPLPPATTCPLPAAFTMPVHEYPNFDNPMVTGQGCSVTGGFVYRGCAMADLRGTYFYADFCAAFVRTFTGVENGRALNHADRTTDVDPPGNASIGLVSSFGEDARGELYIADYDDGEIFRIVPGG
jgi:cysteine-rich repeat protein